jgi:hypothetical protein
MMLHSESTLGFIGFLKPEDARWSEALAHVAHDFFHLPGYLETAAPHEQGEPLLFLQYLGDCGMLMPVIRRSLEGFGEGYAAYSDLTSPYGYPCPLYWGDHWESHLPEMHERFYAFLREEKIVSIFLRMNPFLGAGNDLLATTGEVNTHGPLVYIDLRDAAKSWAGFNRGNRNSINRMLHHGCTVKIDDWETCPRVIEAYYETMKRLTANPFYFFPPSYFQKLREAAPAHFHLATAFSPEGVVMGGCFFTEVGGLIQYFLMGALEAHVESSPSKLVINAIRLWGLEQGHHTLNLGGGVGAQKDGLFDFKVRLSKTCATFSTFRKVLLPDLYEALARPLPEEARASGFFPVYRWARTPNTVNAQ